MRSALTLLVALGCSSSAQAPAGKHFITLDRDGLATASAVTQQKLFMPAASEHVAVIELGDEHLEALSERMHVEHHRCGGFVVHDTLEEALAALEPAPIAATFDYTIDRGSVVRDALPALDKSRILATITELSAMQNRYYQSESGVKAAHWLRDRWKTFTTRSDVTVELFDHAQWAQQSVIMTIPGTTKPDEIVVIGGHLDSIAPGGRASNAPGADDDASGIATLTEIARVLLANNYRPERTLQFMAYAAEEVGLRGSKDIVADYKKRNKHVVGVMQLDMTNYQGSDKDIWLMKDYTNPAQNAFVSQLIDTYTGATWGVDACGYGCSDHASWYRAGFAASMPFESRMRQGNKKIHTKEDTLERSNNNADHAIKFARLGTSYAIEMAKGNLGGTHVAATLAEPKSCCGGGNLLLKLLGGALLISLLVFPLPRVLDRR
ncbi:MAG: M20/M25/M40 family metallo-hydrolase [Kofleriaceae bacterium]